MNQPTSILRLRKKHAPDPERSVENVDVQKMLEQQSLRRAVYGALLALLILNAMWAYSSMLFDRFYPWGSIVQGFLVGRAVRHFGRGLNGRFSLVAAAFALLGAFSGSFVASLNLTAREFGVDALSLIPEITWHTIATFLTRDFGVVGLIYAVTATLLAAFFAKRRLDRYEEVALQKFRDVQRHD